MGNNGEKKTEPSKERRKSGPKVDLAKESKDTTKSGRSSKGKGDWKNTGKVKKRTEGPLNLTSIVSVIPTWTEARAAAGVENERFAELKI